MKGSIRIFIAGVVVGVVLCNINIAYNAIDNGIINTQINNVQCEINAIYEEGDWARINMLSLKRDSLRAYLK